MRAIVDGRIRDSVSRNDRGDWLIEPEGADAEWQAWTAHDRRPDNPAGGRPPRTGTLFPETAASGVALSHARAAAERIQVDAELKRLELEARRGNLVDRNVVARAAFGMARELTSELEQLPLRVTALVRGAPTEHEGARILAAEIANALAQLSSSRDWAELVLGEDPPP